MKFETLKKRKNLTLFILLFFSFTSIILLENVKAECIEIYPSQIEYLPQETFQAEIFSQADIEILRKDVFLFLDNSQMYSNFNILKIDENKYFLFFDLPKYSGNYELRIKTYCSGNLKTFQKDILVKEPIENFYNYIKEEVYSNLDSVSLEQLIFLGKIFDYDLEFHEKLYGEYLKRKENCLSSECKTEFLSLTGISFPETKTEVYKKLNQSINLINGEWKLIIPENYSLCNLSINKKNVSLNSNQQFLNLNEYINETNIAIEVYCSDNQKIVLNNFFNSAIKTFYLKQENIGEIYKNILNLENNLCWGNYSNEECNILSTLYAEIFLKQENKLKEETNRWLYSKQEEMNNQQKLILGLISNNLSLIEKVMLSQSIDGWIPESNIYYKEDVLATALLINSLKENQNNLYSQENKNAKEYLRKKFYNTPILTKERILFFAFTKDEIEPIISFYPGIIFTKSQESIEFSIKNNGLLNRTILLSFLNKTTEYNLSSKETKNIKINLPFIGTKDEKVIKENTIISFLDNQKTIYLPILIQTEFSNENTNIESLNYSSEEFEGEINSSQQNINYSEIDVDLVDKNFYFNIKNISENLTDDVTKEIVIKLKNNFDEEIENIEIIPSSSLISLQIEITPSSISKLGARAEKEIKLIFDASQSISSKTYTGEFVVKGYIHEQKVEINLPIILNVQLQEEDKTCAQLNGKECGSEEKCNGKIEISSDVSICCIGTCESNVKNNSVIGFVIFFILLLLLVGLFFVFRKKPKKEMNEFMKEAEKRYSSAFKKPKTTVNPQENNEQIK